MENHEVCYSLLISYHWKEIKKLHEYTYSFDVDDWVHDENEGEEHREHHKHSNIGASRHQRVCT